MSTFADDLEGSDVLSSVNKYFSKYVLFFGIVSVILGAIIVVNPVKSITAAAYFFGAILVFLGIGQFVYAFNGHSSPTWRIVYAIIGILSVILGFGALTTTDPTYAIYLLATYVGVVWVMRGFSSLFLAFEIKGVGLEVFHFLAGLVGIIAGFGMLYSPFFASITVTFLALYIGIVLIVYGICEIIGALIKK